MNAPTPGPPARKGLRLVLDHPGLAALALAAVVLAFGVILPGVLTYQNLRRVDQIETSIAQSTRIQDVAIRLQRSLIQDLGGDLVANLLMVEALRGAVAELGERESTTDPNTAAAFQELDRLLARSDVLPQNVLVAGLGLIRQLMQEKVDAQRVLLEQMRADAQRELRVALGGVVAFLALLVAGLWLVPTRVVRPLASLRELLSRLARGDRETAPMEDAHPLLLPLFENYNELVTRLEELEAANRAREESLEQAVGAATRALLEQHRTLANAERLAAAGATTAGVAHELKNPLAGMLVSVDNLKRDIDDPDLGQRLDLLRAELDRTVNLLNTYLASARHQPESVGPVRVSTLVDELLTLLRYQVPDGITLESSVAPELTCDLPRDRIRQALLNLVLNSVQALGPGGGTIRVEGCSDESGVRLSVLDDGPGFPEGLVQRPVQPFTTARSSGTGLGLAMVRRTIQDLGGRLELENRTPTGAAAHLWIPCHV